MRLRHKGRGWTKFKGDYCARLVKRAIEDMLVDREDIQVTGPNVFIKDYPTEIDLLLVRQNAEPDEYTVAYSVDQAVAWVEVKAHGTYGKKSEIPAKIKEGIVESFDRVRRANPRIQCAYVTLTERCTPPRNGTGSFWELTQKGLDTYSTSAFCLAETPLQKPQQVLKHQRVDDWGRFGKFIHSL